jgi:hypothetical protein
MNPGEWTAKNGRKYRWKITESAGHKYFDSQTWNDNIIDPHWYISSIPLEQMSNSQIALERLREQEEKQPKLMGLVEQGSIERIEKRLDVLEQRIAKAEITETCQAPKIVDLPMTPQCNWLNTKFRLVLKKKPVLEWLHQQSWTPVPSKGLFMDEQVNAVVEAAYYAGIKAMSPQERL